MKSEEQNGYLPKHCQLEARWFTRWSAWPFAESKYVPWMRPIAEAVDANPLSIVAGVFPGIFYN